MRHRNMGQFVLRHALWVAVLAGGIGCDKNPAAPSPSPYTPAEASGPAVPSVRSLAIGGTLSLHQPGDAGQLTVTATMTDGTVKDVTAEAAWSWLGSTGRVTVSAGVITALTYGSVSVKAAYSGHAILTDVRVAPEGAFLLNGPVTDGGPNFWLHDARVEATSAAGTYSTTTGASGRFTLPGAGLVTLRASKDGFDDAVVQVTVVHDQQVTLALQRRQEPGTIVGRYTLVFTASPSCTLPPEARQRTYTAQIEEGRLVGFPEDLVVMLNGAKFEWDEAGFTGARDGTAVRFAISDAYDARLAVIENLGTMNMGYQGTATGVLSGNSIVAAFNGRVRLSPLAGGSTIAECAAPDHRLEFTR